MSIRLMCWTSFGSGRIQHDMPTVILLNTLFFNLGWALPSPRAERMEYLEKEAQSQIVNVEHSNYELCKNLQMIKKIDGSRQLENSI